jgi:hypothetical protein
MADITPNLNLPFILPSQAQKHVTHNEALLALDALVHLTVLDELSEPPALPAEGASFMVGASASSIWAGKDGAIATWQDGAWNFLDPREGWCAWFVSSGTLKVFSSGNWRGTLPASAGFSMLGVSATPDDINRLAVSSSASLFNHAGNGHQIKVNKASATDTASLLFQSAFTGHAEMGLAGENAFSIKVSDGTNWKTGISVHPAGHVSRPNQPAMRAYRSGTAFLPVDGQQSGFTHIGPDQGGFTLGDTLAGGGSRIIVPVGGLYLACLTVRSLSSSGHVTTLAANGSQPLLSLAGPAGGSGTQAACGIFGLSAGDTLALAHAGTAELGLGDGNTQLSMILL